MRTNVQRKPERRRRRFGPARRRLGPHGLRHTFTSLLVALGVDPGAVMDQIGHEDAAFTLRVYRHAMRRDDQAKANLRALVEGRATAPDLHQPNIPTAA